MAVITSSSPLRKRGYAVGQIVPDDEHEAAMAEYRAEREAEFAEECERFAGDGAPFERIVVDSGFLGGTRRGKRVFVSEVRGTGAWRVQHDKSRQTTFATAGWAEIEACTMSREQMKEALR